MANATNLSGAAGRLTTSLVALGFHTVSATNAAGNEEFLDVSKIYFISGGEAVAGSISQLMAGVRVFPMPVPAPITSATAGLGEATVLVMLGRDRARDPLPGR